MVSSELSTSFSDLVLAVVALLAVQRVHQASNTWHKHLLTGSSSLQETPLASIVGFSCIAFAALLGVFRFGLSSPPARLLLWHKTASWVGGVAGMSLISVNVTFLYQKWLIGWIQIVGVAVLLISAQVLPPHVSAVLEMVQMGAGLLAVSFFSFSHQNWCGVIGALLVVVSGLAIGTQGTLLSMPAVDMFHYVLACALYLLSRALAEIQI